MLSIRIRRDFHVIGYMSLGSQSMEELKLPSNVFAFIGKGLKLYLIRVF